MRTVNIERFVYIQINNSQLLQHNRLMESPTEISVLGVHQNSKNVMYILLVCPIFCDFLSMYGFVIFLRSCLSLHSQYVWSL